MSLFSAEDFFDWAVDMLEQNYDSRHLRILAGMDRKSTSAFEAEEYFLNCIKELNLSVPDSHKAILAYACEAAQEIVDGKISARQGVRKMYQFWIDTDFDQDFVIWLELDDAIDCLIAGEYPHTYESATLGNFESIVKLEAENFIGEVNRKLAL